MTAPTIAGPQRKPYDDEIDVYGFTHPGKVRKDNQDHFLICALSKQMVVQQTSLPVPDSLMGRVERLALLMMVADGVGGGAKGDEASRIALEAVTQYVSAQHALLLCRRRRRRRGVLRGAQGGGAGQCHGELLRRGQENPEYRGMATTLDALPRRVAARLSAPGGRQPLLPASQGRAAPDHPRPDDGAGADRSRRHEPERRRRHQARRTRCRARSADARPTPVVTRMRPEWGNVVLLCSDGLTRHVSDDRIRDRLRTMTSSRQVCEDLVNEALEGGGTDNITLIVCRAIPGN